MIVLNFPLYIIHVTDHSFRTVFYQSIVYTGANV